MRNLFLHRFKDGHNLGNLIIAALIDICGDSASAIKETGKLLSIRGKVLPVTIDNSIVIGETAEGEILRGESNVNSPSNGFTRIKNIYHEPKSFLYGEAGIAIRNSDKVIICPGDLYGSIIPNFVVEGMKRALRESKAMKICVVNLFTKRGTYNFKASDFISEIENYSGIKMNKIIVNIGKPSSEIIEKYFSENSRLVEDNLEQSERILRGEFAAEYLSEPKTILRHIPEKIAREIIGL